MNGKISTVVELERTEYNDDDRLFERRYPFWELKFNNDQVCFGFGRHEAPYRGDKLLTRTGDRAWLRIPIFGNIFVVDVARPGTQKPPPARGLSTLTELESTTYFALESIEEVRDALQRLLNGPEGSDLAEALRLRLQESA